MRFLVGNILAGFAVVAGIFIVAPDTTFSWAWWAAVFVINVGVTIGEKIANASP